MIQMHYHYAFYEFSRFKTIGKSQDADDLSDRLFFVLKPKSTSYLTFSQEDTGSDVSPHEQQCAIEEVVTKPHFTGRSDQQPRNTIFLTARSFVFNRHNDRCNNVKEEKTPNQIFDDSNQIHPLISCLTTLPASGIPRTSDYQLLSPNCPRQQSTTPRTEHKPFVTP
jgi:hypothetical protein